MSNRPHGARLQRPPLTDPAGRQSLRYGFTLIELLIVVIIIGLLAAIAIPQFQSVRKKSYRSTMMSDLKNLATSQEVYYNDAFSFSSSLSDLGAVGSDGVTITINEASNTGWSATAVHQGAGGEQCGLYHGSANPAGGDPASVESVIACSF